MSLKSFTCVVPMLKFAKSRKLLSNASSIYSYKSRGCVSCGSFQVLTGVRFSSTQENTSTDEKNKLIYYGILTPQIRAVKLFSLLTSMTGIAVQPFLINNVVPDASIPAIVGIYSFVGFFTFGTPLLLNFITKKYVTHLAYNSETKTYEATTYNLFITKNKLKFKPEDVRVPDIAGAFTTFEVKGKSLFVEPRLFEDPSHYGKIMGYDKPLDLKLFETSLNEKKK